MRQTTILIILFALCMTTKTRADILQEEIQQDTCSTTENEHRFAPQKLILPATLIAVGAFGVENGAMHKLNNEVRNAYGNGDHKRIRVDEVMPYLPAVASYGLDLCGVKAKHEWKDRTILLAMSFVITQGMVQSTKRIIKEWRPDGSDHHSFPSGHTASAFMGAELLRMEYSHQSPWISVAGYAIATGTGALRMYNDRHWLNDVIAGAGVGILGTRIAYWIYPWVQQHLVMHNAKKTTSALLMPYYDNTMSSNGAYGMMLAVSF